MFRIVGIYKNSIFVQNILTNKFN